MSEVKNKKKKSSMIQVSIGVLAVILAILIIIMMGIVSDIQGTARIVNYTGLVRGETQRIIKLEVAGEQDDAMIQEVRSFIDGLRNGNTKLNLVYLNDTDFQNKMQELDEGFSDLIGISRLYLYVHYPTDVLGGVLAGAISGYLGYRFIQAIFYRIKQEGGGPCPK